MWLEVNLINDAEHFPTFTIYFRFTFSDYSFSDTLTLCTYIVYVCTCPKTIQNKEKFPIFSCGVELTRNSSNYHLSDSMQLYSCQVGPMYLISVIGLNLPDFSREPMFRIIARFASAVWLGKVFIVSLNEHVPTNEIRCPLCESWNKNRSLYRKNKTHALIFIMLIKFCIVSGGDHIQSQHFLKCFISTALITWNRYITVKIIVVAQLSVESRQ